MFLSSSTASAIELNLLLERNLVTLFEQFRLNCPTICKMILTDFDVIFRFCLLSSQKKVKLKWYHHAEVRYQFTVTRQDEDLLGSMESYPLFEGGGGGRGGCRDFVGMSLFARGWGGGMGLLCKFACYTTLNIINISNKFLNKNKVKCANNMSNNFVHVSNAYFHMSYNNDHIKNWNLCFLYSLITRDTYIW